MLELQLEIQLEGQINLEMEIQNTEIVVVDGFDYFDINWINPTLSAGTLTADFAFSPSPQEDVTKIELWINGSLAETRMSNDESAFVVNGIVGGAEVQIKAYNNDLLMQQSDVFQLPIPNAPDFIDFSFGSSKTIDIIAESSDPQNLPITIKYLGIPTNGLVSLLDSDTISVQEIDRNNPTLIPYVIENSVGATDSGEITFHWEEISISIDTPTENQEIPSDEDITVAFTVTPAQQNYISAIALVVDGVEVEKRTPYSTDDFTIAAGTLDVDTHTIVVRAYDVNDEVVYNTQAVSVGVVASYIYLLDEYPGAILARDFFKLSSTYNGNCIRVFRTSDSQEFEIGFATDYIGKPYLDVNYLLSLYNGSAIYGVRTYDQSGNGNDLFAPAEVNMPMIVDAAGNLVSDGLFAMLDFDGANDYLQTSVGLNFGTGARSVFTVQKPDAIGIDGIVTLSNITTSGRSWAITSEVAVRTNSVTWVSSTPLSIVNLSLLSNIYTGGNLHSGNSMWIDGLSVARTGGNDGAIDTQNEILIDGAIQYAGFYFNGKKSSLVIYKSDQTVNREAIEQIIMNNYGMV